MVRPLYPPIISLSKGLSTRLLSSKVLFLFASFLLLLSLLLLSPAFSSSGIFEHAIAQRQQPKMPVTVAFSSLINNNSGSTVIPAGLNNFSQYDNSTYGIRFLSPDGWNKMEILAGRATFIEFTSPLRNVTEGIELPAQVVISIEKGLGNVTTLQQYIEAGDKLLNTVLGNFTATPQSITLSGQPAISRTIATKNSASGIDIFIAQIVAIKNDNAYTVTYTAPASIYHSYLPIVQQILDSFQITK
jgi:hypothetical protein